MTKSASNQGELTRLLAAIEPGDQAGWNRLFAIVYDALRALAQAALANERSDHTLQPTALVHEAYLRLVDQREVTWQNRNHFFGVASQAMRRILVDHARARYRQKRGGDAKRVDIASAARVTADAEGDLIALDEALTRLAKDSEVDARIVEMRFFAGLTEKEIAAALGMTDRTVRRHWNYAKAWLFREISKGDGRAAAIATPSSGAPE